MSAAIEFSPLKPINVVAGPYYSVPTTGTRAAITTGTFTGFLATTDAPDATTADATLSADLTYVGTNSDGLGGTYPAGSWLFQLAASAVTKALCETHFAPLGKAYLIINRSGVTRDVIVLTYKRSSYATITP